MGNIKNLIQAMAALYLLNVYYRNERWITNYNDADKLDLSLGSGIFTVKKPKKGELWVKNEPIQSDSPYVLKYKSEKYELIKKMMQQDESYHMKYFNSQPEINDHLFKEMLSNNETTLSCYEKLGQFRFNKTFQNAQTFTNKQKILTESQEWNNPLIKHISENELSESNIQNEIDSIGQQLGRFLWIKTRTYNWTEAAFTNNWCEVCIE